MTKNVLKYSHISSILAKNIQKFNELAALPGGYEFGGRSGWVWLVRAVRAAGLLLVGDILLQVEIPNLCSTLVRKSTGRLRPAQKGHWNKSYQKGT